MYNDYVVFDLETTGLDKDKDKIIEIGCLKYINNELVDKLDILVNPLIKLPEVIVNLTGITDNDLSNKESIEKAIPKFLEFIGNLPIIGHNVEFDLGFINKNLKNYNYNELSNSYVDTVVLAKQYVPKLYNYKLETVKKYFKLDTVSHRATGDCDTTNYLYQECKKRKELNHE